ncbi:Jerky protein-like-like [Holothuria leucospilota]|uniref:Jerky protein-like-like n=1 Tax=Holothuria leucospilota TaxID=206669 RepID=A0A9Q1HEP9_HOLLE|nr:Jerky protein-like-like [Holothuria leucospilota]
MRQPRDWKPVQGQWSQNAMMKAIKSVKDGELGIRKAAHTYGVPKSTLQRRIKKGIINMPASRPPVFTKDEEALLHDHVLEMEKMGFGLTIGDVCRIAFEMAEEGKIPHRFNKGKKRAGYDWYSGFCGRHPDLSLGKPEALSAARASMLNPTVIKDYFRKLGDLLKVTGLEDKPSQIYNADETGFSLVHTPSKILAKKGKRTVQARTSAERGENVTALICGNAGGTMLPPFLIFKGQRLNPGLTLNAPANTLFGVGSSSFIDAELFKTWFEKLFLKHIPPVRPVLLVMDGHGAHISLSTLKLAKSNSVHIYCLPPHTTNHTQPLDKAVFKSMKSRYNQKCEQCLRDNPGKLITRYDFCSLFKSSYYSEITMSNIVSGFRATGVYPFDPNAIKEEHLQQSTIEAQLTFEDDEPPADEISHPRRNATTVVESAPTPPLPPGNITVSTAVGSISQPKAVQSVQPTSTTVCTTTNSTTAAGPSPPTDSIPSTSCATPFALPSLHRDKFQKSLEKPVLRKKISTQKSRRITEGMCMTSDEIISNLEQKQREKDEKNALKEARKLAREQKRREQEQQKQQKLAKKKHSKHTRLRGIQNQGVTH